VCGVIFLGASQFSKQGLDNPAFATSKARIAEVLTTDYMLAKRVEHLDLFDQDRLPPGVIEDIQHFLDRHRDLTDLIVYYCGHGGFLPDQSFYLTLRATQDRREATTGLQVKQLAIDLENLLFGMRTYLVLDCCFAAAAVKAWMLDGPLSTLMADQTEAVFPRTGTALLAAASEKTAALAPLGRETTLFSGHLVEAIRDGIKRGQAQLSLADLADSVRGRIGRESISRKVMPFLHVPRQDEGDVSRMPLVRNAAAARDFVAKHAGASGSWEAPSYQGSVQITYGASGLKLHHAPPPPEPPPSLAPRVEPELEVLASQRQELDPPARRLLELTRRIVNRCRPMLSKAAFPKLPKATFPKLPKVVFPNLPRAASGLVAAGTLCAGALVGAALYWPPSSEPVAEPDHSLSVDDGVNEAGGGRPPGGAAQDGPDAGPNLADATLKTDPVAAPAMACSGALPLGGGVPASSFAIRPLLQTSDVEPLRAIAFSPDGKKFATTGDDGMVRMWDASSFTLDAVLKPAHRDKARSVAFSKDGSLLASASWDGTVQVWNTATGELKKRFVTAPVTKQYAVAFDSERPAKYVTSAGKDGIINIWSLREGAANAHKPGHKNAWWQERRIVHSLSYSPKGASDFVSGGFDGRINYYYFSASDRADVASIDTSSQVFRVAYAPNDERVVSAGGDGKFKLWLAKDKKVTAIRSYGEYGSKERVTAAAWSPDGKRLLSGSGDGAPMRLWNVDNEAKPLRQYTGHKKDVEGVAFHPSSPRLVSASEDGTMKVWDAESSSELFTVVPFKDGQYLAYTPGGCYTGSAADRHFKLYTGNKETALTGDVKNALFVPDGFGELVVKR
jgi:WD40 repeat protein